MGRIGWMTGMGMCGALALAGASPVPAQGVGERPSGSVSNAEDADYQWIDDADALLDAIGDAPPDFTFAHDGGDILGWRTGTGHAIYAEPLGGGAIRYYYFEPGSREPFLVQDEAFAFGYRPGGRLIVVYDADGRLLSRSEGDREAALAERLYRRGRAIHASARNDRGWAPVDAGYWAEQVPIVVDLRLRWSSGRDRHPGWRRWHGRTGAAKWRAPLAGERQRRWSAGDRFRRWQRDGFRGRPPRFGDDGTRPVPGVRPPRPDRPEVIPPLRPDRPEEIRPAHPDTMPGTPGTRPWQPRPGWVRPRPPLTGTPPVVEAPVAPSPEAERPQRPSRPGWIRPRPQGGDAMPGTLPSRFGRPPGFTATERPSPPPRVQPAERPQFTPRPAAPQPAYAAPPPPPPPPPPRPVQPRVSERSTELPQ